jgi:2-C-methyl-D-erythritol 2,4-cyclodiphosphate synthase
MSLQPEYRFGIGFDVHRLVKGRPLILGGITISHDRGLDGHSDADALLHALTDAILGAIAEGDIGQHFSNTDPRWKDSDSGVFVEEAVRLATQRGYHVGNVDAVIMAEQPKMAPYIKDMRRRIAELLGVDMSLIGVKAGTMERMGFVGREEGIACQAVVSLVRIVV